MSVTGFFIGFGCHMKYKDLGKILEIKSSPKDGVYDYDYVCKIEEKLKKNPIEMSDDELYLQIVTYPHTYHLHKNYEVAIGVFHDVEEYCDGDDELEKLRNVLNTELYDHNFCKKFGKRMRFMIIPNGCNCCT